MENRNESGKKQKAKGLCPNFGKCGGCQYLDVPYEEQLKKKKKMCIRDRYWLWRPCSSWPLP